MVLVITVLAAFALGLIFGKLAIPALHALKAGQSIREIGPKWHNTKAGTPTMGGVIFIGASLVCLATGWKELAKGQLDFVYVLLVSLAFGLIGFADDYVKVRKKRNLGLTALQKFALQLVVSGVYLYLLYQNGNLSYDLYIPFFQVSFAITPMVYMVFAMFVMVGCVNAVNLTDGIDGLAAGVTMPVMIFFVVIATLWQKTSLALFPAALLGGLAAFLCYNFHPAKVFMGDTGSLFLGGAVCGLAFALDMPVILVLVGIIYIIETLSDILQVGYFKLTHGKRIFRMAPIHHHLEMGGWSEVKIFTVFTAVTCIFCVLAALGVWSRY